MVDRLTQAFAVLALLTAGPAFAQDTKPGCGTAAPTTAATPPAQGPSSGTAPGGMGSSGWSGGTGGSYVGTNPQGATPASPSSQPATATGLDPTKPGQTNDASRC